MEKTQNFPQTYVRSASWQLQANYLRSWFQEQPKNTLSVETY
jgi:hypothetical protein